MKDMKEFLQNNEITYEDNPYVAENSFIGKEPHADKIPTYDEVKDQLPQPIFDGHDDYLRCYDYAWRTAFGNIASPFVNDKFVSDFIKTAFKGHLP